MDDYIKRDDALDLCACDLSKPDHKISYHGAMIEMTFRIGAIPADSDVVKVVRCEHCIENDDRLPNGEIVCNYWCACVPPDFFCGVGKRKENEK